MLTISVKNFGPIAKGSVDLKPLTIFVGPSNTGKSYMATAVHAVIQAVGRVHHEVALRGAMWPFGDYRSGRLRGWDPNWGRAWFQAGRNDAVTSVETLRAWIHGIDNLPENATEFTVSDLPDDVCDSMEHSANMVLDIMANDVKIALRRSFTEDSAFARNGLTDTFSLTFSRVDPKLSVNVQLTNEGLLPNEFDISSASLGFVVQGLWEYRFDTEEDPEESPLHRIFNDLRVLAPAILVDELPYECFYLPAARSGIAQGYKVLAATLVRRSSRIGLEPLSIPALPAISTEFLSDLIGLPTSVSRDKKDSDLWKAINFIETEVLHGRIDLDNSAGLPFPDIAYETSTDKFNLDQTSSMVSELAPLILFLKYLVRPGDLLILEEPESHLHPAAQLQMARGIARLVNAGVRVLITTHSNDFTGQINNLISMSNTNEETWKSLELEPEECLQPNQVSAYGFRLDPDLGGAVTYPLPVGSDVGIEDEEFLPVIELLYEQAITLQRNRLS